MLYQVNGDSNQTLSFWTVSEERGASCRAHSLVAENESTGGHDTFSIYFHPSKKRSEIMSDLRI